MIVNKWRERAVGEEVESGLKNETGGVWGEIMRDIRGDNECG